PNRISTRAACTVEKVGEGFKITRMRLEVRGKVPRIDEAAFRKAAEEAKQGCPVSTALQGNVQFELDARLE
ncbi:MAG TPA: OsmC family protein, partial [Gemmatimonadales bacterium]|nr:OsmC family protein [Gemmatimonadales bacterium]